MLDLDSQNLFRLHSHSLKTQFLFNHLSIETLFFRYISEFTFSHNRDGSAWLSPYRSLLVPFGRFHQNKHHISVAENHLNRDICSI